MNNPGFHAVKPVRESLKISQMGSSSNHEQSFEQRKRNRKNSEIQKNAEGRWFLSALGPSPVVLDSYRASLTPFLVLRFWSKPAIHEFLCREAFSFGKTSGNNFDQGATPKESLTEKEIETLQNRPIQNNRNLIWNVLAYEVLNADISSVDDVVETLHLPSDMPMDWYSKEALWLPKLWLIWMIIQSKMHKKLHMRTNYVLDSVADIKRLVHLQFRKLVVTLTSRLSPALV